MAVYVDNMRAKFGRYTMCHMISDTDDLIGVARKWWQSPAKASSSHYDIALSKRGLAVENGAVEITLRQSACMTARRNRTGELGSPEDAVRWMMDDMTARRMKATSGSL